MRKLAFVMAVLLALVISGCESTGSMPMASSSGGNDKAAVESLIKEAEAAVKKAGAAGGEWRDSNSKLIKAAKAALSKGDLATAKKKAMQAKFEGETAYQQAMGQKNAGPWLF